MNNPRLVYLYRQYIHNDSTAEELEELKLLLNAPDHQQDFNKLLDGTWDAFSTDGLQDLSESRADHIYSSIVAEHQPDSGEHLFKLNSRKKTYRSYRWIGIAASIALLFSVTLFLHRAKNTKNITVTKAMKPKLQEAMPGSNKAILTLGNGKSVVLDDAHRGEIAGQEGVVINKVKDGQLVYSSNGTTRPGDVQQNTITIPKGGQYHVILPDGTAIFLNSASSLTYPTRFTGNTRRVTLTGEAYFEVFKNPKMPFRINVSNKQEIEVLGTHFNVKAYIDESTINTTLLEGAVRIATPHQQLILKPGQIATNDLTHPLVVKPADLEEIMAWKNGMFIFNNENITAIMKKISRWYDVDVVFKGDMENINFIGNYSRSKSLSSLLQNIELTDKVHFNVEGRRITVIAK